MGGVRKDKVKNLIRLVMEKFIDGSYVFEKTNEFPDGYEIWAIGRRNFEHKGYVPLCEVDENNNVKRDTLKALKVKDEVLALSLLYEAVKRGVNKKKYNKMISA
jgi:hypothetical protein